MHAFSGDAHVAGEGGWWSNLIGSGKGIDTDKYFVICSNVIGGCSGSTGPSSTNPKTGKPYGTDFPLITIGDMVNAQRHLIDHLGIEKLLSVIGGSMGGMQVLQWMTPYPKRIRSAIPIATTLKHTSPANRLQRSRHAKQSWLIRLAERQLLRQKHPRQRLSDSPHDWSHNLHE